MGKYYNLRLYQLKLQKDRMAYDFVSDKSFAVIVYLVILLASAVAAVDNKSGFHTCNCQPNGYLCSPVSVGYSDPLGYDKLFIARQNFIL